MTPQEIRRLYWNEPIELALTDGRTPTVGSGIT